MSSQTTTITVSRHNKRRLDALEDVVREKAGKARVSLNDVVEYLLDAGEGKPAGARSLSRCACS